MFVNVIGWSKTSGYLSVQLFSTGIAGVLEPGGQGGGATAPQFCWELTKIAKKYGFFLKIHGLCPPLLVLLPLPPLFRKFLTPEIYTETSILVSSE